MRKRAYKNYSVLMSVYAKENPEYLRQSMQSIYDQTVPTDDFVLICDGPLTPELDKVIADMQEKFGKRLRVFRQPENRGLGLSLKYGILKCKNELVARMDSDDASKKDRCEKQIALINKLKVDVVGSNITEYDETMQNVFAVKNVPETNEDIKKYAKRRNPINHVSALFKKSEVLNCGNYVDMLGFEDYYLWARMMQSEKSFYNIQESLVSVRGGDSMIKRRGGLKYLSQIYDFEKSLKDIGFISYADYIYNIVTRVVFSVAPSRFRKALYGKVLRTRTRE